MARPILDETQLHPSIRERVGTLHSDVVDEVRRAIEENATVVVGMRGNPHCRKARQILDAGSIPYAYLEYGGYLSEWRRRNALKMWTGWPTFPMVFHGGVLLGGASDLASALAAGEVTAG